MRTRLRAALQTVTALALASAGMLTCAQEQEERALAAVRAEISALEARLDREHAAREREYASLERAEIASAGAKTALEALRGKLADNRRRNGELANERTAIQARLGGEREALARQVRMSFLTGREETLKLLLNQEEPARLGRMITYYDYLNRARAERIERVGNELGALAEVLAESERVADELRALERDRQAEAQKVERLRAERADAVATLDRSIESDEAAVARLQSEERRLSELVQELEAALAEFPVNAEAPFASNRGALPWPVVGTLLNRFGEARAGPKLRWQGVQVAAAAGTAVRAIYHGRIVYSDWLPGLGLLVIVDHGDGYMSLYGHNEALLKEAGEWVTPGEAIAQVGDSGGQAQTALYFEIRENGEPVDPRPWLNRPEPQPR